MQDLLVSVDRLALLALQEKRALKVTWGFLGHRGQSVLEQLGLQEEMEPLVLQDQQDLMADLDLMELRGTKANQGDATAIYQCLRLEVDLELQELH